MAPLLFALGTAALVLAGDAAAKQFVLDDTYDSTNFFDKFDFFESKYNTGDYNDVDLSSGYINYRTRVDAQKLGLINNAGGEVYLGPDVQNVTEYPGLGRSSVKLESKAIYNKSLMVARFSHLPKPVCGAWPAFWSYGAPWPQKGELDWYEGWNNAAANKPTAHSYHSEEQGQCIISEVGQISKVNTANCDQWATGQYQNQGCGATATAADPWGSADGGIYAVEWTDDYIKFFSWTHDAAPKDVESDSPDTSSWGTPSMLISNDKCNINSHFSDQKLVINIDFCGVLAGNDFIWKDQCAASTGHDICSSYVAQNPSVYKDTYFKIKDIRIFKEASKPVTSTPASVSAPVPVSALASHSQSQTGTAKVADKSASITASTTAAGTITASASVTKVASRSITDEEDVCTEDDDDVITNQQTHAAPATDAQLTTSTIYTTKVSTVTACPPTVADCPDRIGKVTTQTIALYTTVCPVSPVPAPKPTEPLRGNNHNQDNNDKPNPGPDVSTTTFTTVYTITRCPSSVPDCPIGGVTTKVVTRSIPAVGPSAPVFTQSVPAAGPSATAVTKSIPAVGPSAPIFTQSVPAAGPSAPAVTKSIPAAGPSMTVVTKIAVPSGPGSAPGAIKTLSQVSFSGAPSRPSAPSGSPHGQNTTAPVIKPSGTAPGASTTGCFGASCPTKPVVVNAAVQAGASFALMALGALAVLVL